MKVSKVKDQPHLVRDMHSKAILNTDIASLNEYKEKKKTKTQLEEVSNEINNIKEEFLEVKQLLKQLLDNK